MDNNVYVYGYFENETGKCLYIGISTNSIEERDINHRKPSKYNVQEINKYLQDNPTSWTLLKLLEVKIELEPIIDDKDLIKDILKSTIHSIEDKMVSKYRPPYNKYLK